MRSCNDPQAMRMALRACTTAPICADTCRVLEQHPELLSDAANTLLDVHFINTLPVLVASRHSRESGNPGDERHGGWMPAYAGMTLYWHRTYETDI